MSEQKWHEGWDEFYTHSKAGRYPTEDLIRFVARNFFSVPDRKQVKILEIGCGTGPNLWFLAREGFTVAGIDGSRVALEEAQRYLSREGLSAQLDRGDVTALPYIDQSFDAVIDLECL